MSATTVRVRRAVTEFLHAERRDPDDPAMFWVYSGSGARYNVDLNDETPYCECEDWQGEGDYCKHVWHTLLTDVAALDALLTNEIDE